MHMKIAYVCDADIFLTRNAVYTHIIEVCSNLVKLGHEVTLLYPSETIFKRENKYIFNLEKVAVPRIPIFRSFFQLQIFYIRLTKLPQVQMADLIYHRISGFSFLLAILTRLSKKKYISEINGNIQNEMKMLGSKKMTRFISSLIEKSTYLLSYQIISVTNEIAEYLVNTFKISRNKIITVPNGVNTNIFMPLNVQRKDYDLAQDKNYIGFVGSLTKWQGLDKLFASLDPDFLKKNQLEVLIVGDGPERENLEDFVKTKELDPYVIFKGSVSYEDVPIYINLVDFCVLFKKDLSSGYSPLKLFEYLACGKAVITSKEISLKDFVRKNQCGLAVDIENTAEIVDAIYTLLRDKDLRKRYAQNGMNTVINKYSWLETARKIQISFD